MTGQNLTLENCRAVTWTGW